MTHGRSVRICLADGTVTGIRHAEVGNWKLWCSTGVGRQHAQQHGEGSPKNADPEQLRQLLKTYPCWA